MTMMIVIMAMKMRLPMMIVDMVVEPGKMAMVLIKMRKRLKTIKTHFKTSLLWILCFTSIIFISLDSLGKGGQSRWSASFMLFFVFYLASFAQYHATFCVSSVCIVFTKNDSVLIQKSFLQVLKRRRALATGRARSSESTSKPILSPWLCLFVSGNHILVHREWYS